MSSINDLLISANKVGRYAAGLTKGTGEPATVGAAHHPGDDTGRLVLDAYRNHGVQAMKAVVHAYQDGYNARAAETGIAAVEWEQIKNGILWALPGVTEEEKTAIPEAL